MCLFYFVVCLCWYVKSSFSFLICVLFFLLVLTAFPVEPQVSFSNQSQGEPYPLENCSSMGEGQGKTLQAVLILQRYPTCG